MILVNNFDTVDYGLPGNYFNNLRLIVILIIDRMCKVYRLASNIIKSPFGFFCRTYCQTYAFNCLNLG